MTEWLIRRFVKEPKDVRSQRVRAAYGTLGSMVGVCVNLMLSLLKFLVGMAVGSIAVTADAANNLSDAGGSIVSLVSVRVAQKPMDQDHPFGHGRMEYIGALLVGVLILIMGVELMKEGLSNIFNPHQLSFTYLALGLMSLSVFMKLWLYRFYNKVGKRIDSAALLAAAKDSISDVLATCGVILSMLAGHFFNLPVDGYMGVLVALIVMKAGFNVCRDTVDRLLGGRPDRERGELLTQRLLSYPGILGVHDLVLHDYGPGRCVASVHAEVSAKENIVAIHEVIDQAEREISEELNMPICIHMDPIVTDDEATNAVCARMAAYLHAVDHRLKLHDFRMVPGEKQINLIFDVLLPADYQNRRELEAGIRSHAKSLDPRYECVLHFDLDYYQ